ncbi:hypothetical protein LEMLEM_LOCUS17217 [Lemmus lemmus]
MAATWGAGQHLLLSGPSRPSFQDHLARVGPKSPQVFLNHQENGVLD